LKLKDGVTWKEVDAGIRLVKGGTHTRRNKRTKKLDLEDLKDRQNIRKNSLNMDRFFKVKAKAITPLIALDVEALIVS